MKMSKNMASVIRAYKKLNRQSIAECAAALDVSPTSLKDYIVGRGNPNAATIERMADKMGIDIAFFVSGAFSENQLLILKRLLDVLIPLETLSPEKRNEFVEQLLHPCDCGIWTKLAVKAAHLCRWRW